MVAYFGRYFVRHMNAWRVARWGEPALPAGAGPIVVYSNHPSWWDAADLRARRRPVPARILRKLRADRRRRCCDHYGIFGRIGAFGVDLDSARGAAAFLAASADILSRPDRAPLDHGARPLRATCASARSA